jgi:two-component system, NtrC family, sensor kinase
MRIATRLTVVLLLAVVAVMAAFAYLRTRQERERLTQELQQEVRVLAGAAKLVVEHALRDRRPQDIQELLDELVHEDNPLDRIRILDRNLEPIGSASSERAAALEVPRAELAQAIATGSETLRYLEVPGRPVVYVVLPLRGRRAAIVGALEVVHVATRVERQIAEARRESLLRLGLLGLTIALAIWISVRISIRRPLDRLVRAALALGRGDLRRRIGGSRRDEIGQLAAALDRMAEKLQAAQDRLRTEARARLELERQIQHAQQLAAVGRLASEVAHEMGTPLNVISGRAETVRRQLADDHPLARHLAIILRQADRIGGIIRQLLEYTRPRPPGVRPVEVGRLLERIAELLEPLAHPRGLTFQVQAPDPLPPVLADPDQLQQVVLNLATNAMDATPAGGRIVLTAQAGAPTPEAADAPQASRVGRGPTPEPCVTIGIADRGAGIPADRLERIFEPFFSTKEPGRGTGLGLPIVESIVRAHGGGIRIESGDGQGTTVRLLWPCGPIGSPQETSHGDT